MGKQVLIVGGGLAGTIIANGLCRHLGPELKSGKASITMLGNTDTHMYQPGLLYIPFGRFRESELFRDQRKVLDRRVHFLHRCRYGHLTSRPTKSLQNRARAITYDYVVLATGSRIRPENIPGMAEGAHWFYDLDGARKMREVYWTISRAARSWSTSTPRTSAPWRPSRLPSCCKNT